MSDQIRLFRLAVESLTVSAVFVPGSGWRLTVGSRRQDETWSESERTTYDRLTTAEMLDVLLEEIPHRLQ